MPFGAIRMSIENQPSTSTDLAHFVHFAVQHLEHGGAQISPEELVQRWRSNPEYWETVERIEQNVKAYEQGNCVPLKEAFRQIRERLESRR
jgi:hypothetical protein